MRLWRQRARIVRGFVPDVLDRGALDRGDSI